MESIEGIIDNYKASLVKLLRFKPLRFDSKLRSRLPTGGGVYRVIEIGADWRKSIYVGKTSNLQIRIYTSLLMGNLSAHILKNKMVKSGEFEDKEEVKAYLREKCTVQFLEIENPAERSLFKHFVIAVLKPQWND